VPEHAQSAQVAQSSPLPGLQVPSPQHGLAQSAVQLPQFSPASQRKLPQQAPEQSAGQRQGSSPSAGLHTPSPQKQSAGQLPESSPAVQNPSPQADAQSALQLPASSVPEQHPSPQTSAKQSPQLHGVSPAVQQPSPQVDAQAGSGVQASSVAPQQPSPTTSAQPSPGQVQGFSAARPGPPGSQIPSFSQIGQSSGQLAKSSVPLQQSSPQTSGHSLHVHGLSPGEQQPSPQAGGQSCAQVQGFSAPEHRSSPQIGQSSGQPVGSSDGSQHPSPHCPAQSPGQPQAFSPPARSHAPPSQLVHTKMPLPGGFSWHSPAPPGQAQSPGSLLQSSPRPRKKPQQPSPDASPQSGRQLQALSPGSHAPLPHCARASLGDSAHRITAARNARPAMEGSVSENPASPGGPGEAGIAYLELTPLPVSTVDVQVAVSKFTSYQ
jgi:hypothetical protein